ncbi:MAG: ornithine--acyl-ACP N-acyltransferase OlsB [Ancylobacter novellus]|uniref:L-ornithine N(alpha)-acyltransferase n=1 Tax=Ancylobacter novellus TaxID=921 RepID=A0A2W5KAF7_ANCNO|nr:MAG: ornithine--acyl-ACP N-acyltransferase OlsB [Ancylobacter novellus]
MSIVRLPQAGPGAIVSRFRSHRPAKAIAGAKWFDGFMTSSASEPSRKRLEASAAMLPRPLGRIGGLELRVAERPKDVKKAQKLRYRVFFEEMSAVADPIARLAKRDMDAYDPICDHLIVFDHAAKPARSLAATLIPGLQGFEIRGAGDEAAKKPPVVGTYRLLRQEVAERTLGFYTAGEFDVEPLIARHPSLNFLELGRSCVLKPYRDKRTVELLWHGIWAYVLAHGCDVMIGCASLEGTDPEKLRLPLSYLHHFHAAPPEWAAAALPSRRARFDLLPKEAIDLKAALRSLPPLIKAYLRLGAFVGDGAVVDEAFGTTDVLIVLPKAAINPRYVVYYGADADRHAA